MLPNRQRSESPAKAAPSAEKLSQLPAWIELKEEDVSVGGRKAEREDPVVIVNDGNDYKTPSSSKRFFICALVLPIAISLTAVILLASWIFLPHKGERKQELDHRIT